MYDKRTIKLSLMLVDALIESFRDSLTYKTDAYVDYVAKKIISYRRKSFLLSLINNVLQFIIIVGASSIPFLLNISEIRKEITIIISIVVAVSAALSSYYRFKEYAKHFHISAEKMQQEYSLFGSSRGRYSTVDRGAALDLFMDNIDELRKEQNEITSELDRVIQSQNKDESHKINILTQKTIQK